MGADDVKAGWICKVRMHYDEPFAYVQKVKRRDDGSLLSVCVTGLEPGGSRWNTHWLGVTRWEQVFEGYVGDTTICPECGKVPVACDIGCTATWFECARCGHTWEEATGESV